MGKLVEGGEYYYDGDFYIYIEDVPSMPEFAIMREGGDDGHITVCRKSNLKLKEDSWQWQQKQKHADELRLITQKAQENLDKLTEKLVDKAIISLASRIKFNVAFGSGGSAAPYALMLSQELEKMIKKEAPKVIAEKEDVFA